MANLIHKKIESATKEGDSHLKTIIRASGKLKSSFPLTESSFKNLSEDQIATMDQFIYRFTKLQDSVGLRLFIPLVSLILGNDDLRPFIDTLNTLEKFKLIDSSESWQTLRNLRNNLSHEYPESLKQTVDTLNILFEKWVILQEAFLNCKKYYDEKLKI